MQGHGSNAAFNFQKEMATIINKYRKENFKATQKALEIAADELARTMASNTPAGMGTGLMKRSWGIKKYPNEVYVYNSRGAKGFNLGIPLSNVAEYSRKGPNRFIGRTFEANKQKIVDTFKKEFQKIV
ncbi:MAG: hypothetical protein PF487_13380 [Bacteroidales bacterium]|jgi:hypothetical protein|nr:hypothetical protein [Bacteroidales bacterium]